MILDIGSRSMGTPVEIEYALNLDEPSGKPALHILQLKPLIHLQDKVNVDLLSVDKKNCFICSDKTMGNGRDTGLLDIVWVDPDSFDRSKTLEMAAEIEEIDIQLKKQGRRYILIGPGRWGTRDRWLGIPVSFAQISRAKVIAEVDLPGFVVDSSLGSHFFHNLTSMSIGYMKISRGEGGYIDWSWLRSMPAKMRTAHCLWTSLDSPVDLRMDGRASKAVVLKPGYADLVNGKSGVGNDDQISIDALAGAIDG